MKLRWFAALLLLNSLAFAQSQIPAGTILPVRLSTTINSRKAKAGEKLSAKLMQPVDLGSGEQLRPGTRVEGSIVSIDPYHITLAFDEVIVNDQASPVRTSLRALASMMDVQDAQLPTNDVGGDRGSSIQDWTTAPIGGGALYNPYGGKLMEGNRVVGRALPGGGVVAKPVAVSGAKCRGDQVDGANQAFWVFSPSACGVYGMDLDLVHSGRTDPIGHITLKSHQGFIIRSGSGLLLRVLP